MTERKGKWTIVNGSGRIVIISRDKNAAVAYAKEQLSDDSYGENSGVENHAQNNDGSNDVDVH